MSDKKELKVIFAPGSFDNFEGTQEELDALVKEITDGIQDGSLFDKSEPIDLKDSGMVLEDLETLIEWVEADKENFENTDYKRKLH